MRHERVETVVLGNAGRIFSARHNRVYRLRDWNDLVFVERQEVTKIFFNGGLVYEKDHLPDEKKAMSLLRTYAREGTQEAAEALSAGVDVKINGDWFKVELSSDEFVRHVFGRG